MSEYCVVVVNGAQARLLALEPAEFPEMESGPTLVEREHLRNDELDGGTRDLWANRHSGQNRSPVRGTGKGIPGHRYDDHRSRHREELERRFAKNVAARAARLAREEQAGQVVLVAQKRMLGLLRRELDTLAKAGLGIREIAKDLGRLDPPSIQAHLARERLLPARRGLGGPA